MKRASSLAFALVLTVTYLGGGAPAAAGAEFTVDGEIGGRIFSTGSDLTVVMGPTAACFIDELWLMQAGPNGTFVPAKPAPLATNQDLNKVIHLPKIAAGQEIVFGIRVNTTTSPCGDVNSLHGRAARSDTIFVSGPLTRNADLFPHARVKVANGVATVGFEDVDRRLENNQAPCRSSETPWTTSRIDANHNGLIDDSETTLDTNPADSHEVSQDYRPAWCPDWNDMTFTVQGRRTTSTTQDCTLTIGYWKNHAGLGPQADRVSPLLPQWLGTAGGQSSVQVTTNAQAVTLLDYSSTASNGIDKLYGQLLGAKLNLAAGADGAAVASTITSSDAFLAGHADTSWTGLSGAAQQSVLGWVGTLDAYNNGLTGPGHCQ